MDTPTPKTVPTWYAKGLEREIGELRATIATVATQIRSTLAAQIRSTLAAQANSPQETLTLRDHYMLAVLPGILVAHSGDILADQLARAFEVVDMVLERRKGAPE